MAFAFVGSLILILRPFVRSQEPGQIKTDTIYLAPQIIGRDTVIKETQLIRETVTVKPVLQTLSIDSLISLLSAARQFQTNYRDSIVSIDLTSYVSANALDSSRINYTIKAPRQLIIEHATPVASFKVGAGIVGRSAAIGAGYEKKGHFPQTLRNGVLRPGGGSHDIGGSLDMGGVK